MLDQPLRSERVRQSWIRGRVVACVASLVSLGGFISAAEAQQTFRLVAPGGGQESAAQISAAALVVIDATGRRTTYRRAVEFDPVGRAMTAYYNSGLDQIVRWPVSNSGPLQIGRRAAGSWSFRRSQMQVLPHETLPPAVGIPPVAAAGVEGDHRLTTVAGNSRGLNLRTDRSGTVALVAGGADVASIWSIRSAGRGYYHIHGVLSGSAVALACSNRTARVLIAPIANAATQLWRISPHPSDSRYWLIENAALPGRALAGGLDGLVVLESISDATSQRWLPLGPPAIAGYQPATKVISKDLRPSPELPPVQVSLANSHESELLVLIQDRRPGGPLQQIRIPAGGAVAVTFERDPGATLVETSEVLTLGGFYERHEFVTVLPPLPYYDLSVYERFLQSIAIDRTGKSPQTIEDINYQPKSVGWFLLPPGDQLSAGPIDVYQTALAANNPGMVRRLDWGSSRASSAGGDALKAILERAGVKP